MSLNGGSPGSRAWASVSGQLSGVLIKAKISTEDQHHRVDSGSAGTASRPAKCTERVACVYGRVRFRGAAGAVHSCDGGVAASARGQALDESLVDAFHCGEAVERHGAPVRLPEGDGSAGT